MSDKLIKIVEEINKSFEVGKTEDFLAHCTDEVSWSMVGHKSVSGKDAIREWMSQMEGMEPPNFTVDKTFSDGEMVACCGDMKLKAPDSAAGSYSFCDVYRFEGDKVVDLRSYVVKLAHESADTANA